VVDLRSLRQALTALQPRSEHALELAAQRRQQDGLIGDFRWEQLWLEATYIDPGHTCNKVKLAHLGLARQRGSLLG